MTKFILKLNNLLNILIILSPLLYLINGDKLNGIFIIIYCIYLPSLIILLIKYQVKTKHDIIKVKKIEKKEKCLVLK